MTQQVEEIGLVVDGDEVDGTVHAPVGESRDESVTVDAERGEDTRNVEVPGVSPERWPRRCHEARDPGQALVVSIGDLGSTELPLAEMTELGPPHGCLDIRHVGLQTCNVDGVAPRRTGKV